MVITTFSYLMVIILSNFLIDSPAMARGGHEGTKNSTVTHQKPRTVYDGKTESCLEQLTNEQKKTLEEISTIIDSPLSPKVKAERIHAKLTNNGLTQNQRGLVAALAYSEIKLVAQSKLQSSSGINAKQVKELISFGAVETPEGLDLSQLDLSKLPKYREALVTLFPESASQIDLINNQKNSKPVVLGNYVIMGKFGLKDSQNADRILTQNQYATAVKGLTSRLEVAFKEYQEAANAASSKWGVLRGEVDSSIEVRSRNAYNHLVRTINQLEHPYGYPLEKIIALRKMLMSENNRQSEFADKSYVFIRDTGVVLIMAPAIWPIIAIGAAIGAPTAMMAGGFAVAGFAGNAVGEGINLAIKGEGTLACNIGNVLINSGPHAIYGALTGALLGFGVAH